VKRWQVRDIDGTVVAGGNEKVNRFDQFNHLTHIFVDLKNDSLKTY
jgi:hypothetical protein